MDITDAMREYGSGYNEDDDDYDGEDQDAVFARKERIRVMTEEYEEAKRLGKVRSDGVWIRDGTIDDVIFCPYCRGDNTEISADDYINGADKDEYEYVKFFDCSDCGSSWDNDEVWRVEMHNIIPCDDPEPPSEIIDWNRKKHSSVLRRMFGRLFHD